MDDELTKQLSKESRRLEEDVIHSEKGHFASAGVLRTTHLGLGIIAAVGAAIAGANAFSGSANAAVAGTAGLVAAVASAVMTFAKPQELADKHQTVGTRYGALRGRLRRFRELTLLEPETEQGQYRADLEQLADQKAELDTAGPGIPRYGYIRGRKSLEAGEASYAEDKSQTDR
jgi:hypothetical protein